MYRAEMARVLSLVNRYPEAAEAAREVMDTSPVERDVLLAVGLAAYRVQAMEVCREAFSRLARLYPSDPHAQYNLGVTEMSFGRFDAAEACFENCLRLDPAYWQAYLQRSQLRAQQQDSNHLRELEQLWQVASEQPAARVSLGMALSKELEDLGEFERAFAYLKIAKDAVARTNPSYTPERDEAIFETIHEAFASGMPTQRGAAEEDTIFVVGMPRSGTTLVEQMLAAHSTVEASGELPTFLASLWDAHRGGGQQLFDKATFVAPGSIDLDALAQTYSASNRHLRVPGKRLLDKLPHNFTCVGWIAAALPKARIVCVHRDPLDTCISNYRQLFATGHRGASFYDYSADLQATARHFVGFRGLAAMWSGLLPGRVIDVNYESLVADPELQLRRLLEFCGLGWEASCLAFGEKTGPVTSASAVEVRTPLNTSAIGRWRRYEAHLGPVRDVLECARQ